MVAQGLEDIYREIDRGYDELVSAEVKRQVREAWDEFCAQAVSGSNTLCYSRRRAIQRDKSLSAEFTINFLEISRLRPEQVLRAVSLSSPLPLIGAPITDSKLIYTHHSAETPPTETFFHFAKPAPQGPALLTYRLIKTTQRLTLDIVSQDPKVTWYGDDDGDYYTFTASNGYQVISRSRMDIQTERIWLLGAKRDQEQRSGTMVFSSNEKRDRAYGEFIKAINEWAAANNGHAVLLTGD